MRALVAWLAPGVLGDEAHLVGIRAAVQPIASAWLRASTPWLAAPLSPTALELRVRACEAAVVRD